MIATIRPTRFKELGYRQDAPRCWRIMDITSSQPAAVGPQYQTRTELFGDLNRFALEFGCEEAALLQQPHALPDSAAKPLAANETRIPFNAGKPWDDAQDARLRALVSAGDSIAAIALRMQRTPRGIEARCERLDLLFHMPLCEPASGCDACNAQRARRQSFRHTLHEKAPLLKDALTDLLVELRKIALRDNASIRLAMDRATRLLTEVDAAVADEVSPGGV